MQRTIIAATAIAFLSSPAIAQRAWDVDRYTTCLTVEGEGELADTMIVRSMNCRTARDPVVETEGQTSGRVVAVRASAAGARDRDNAANAFVSIMVGTRLERTDTLLSGRPLTSDGQGFLVYQGANTMVAGQRTAMTMEQPAPNPPTCSRERRGSISVRTCTYVEGAAFALTPDMLSEVQARYASDPTGMFRLRLSTSSSVALTIDVPLAEIEAVRRRIFPSG